MAPYRLGFELDLDIDKFILSFIDEYELLSELVLEKMYYSRGETKKYFENNNYGPIESNISLAELIKRPNLDPVKTLETELLNDGLLFNVDVVRAVAISNKYEGYINRSNVENEKLLKLSRKKLDLTKILNSKNISFECLLRIKQVMPETFGQLQKIDGIRPATLAYIAGNVL
jgi:tRNA uridine 5-carboxymethylaminomethyl modification enzyme